MVSAFGDSLSRLAVPLILYQMTQSPVSLGISIALMYLPYTLFGLGVGVIVDRYDRWRVLIGSNLLQFMIVLSLGVLQVSGVLTVAHVYIAVFLMTTMSIPEATASLSVLNEVVPRDSLLQANKWLNGGAAVAETAAPPIGAVLFSGVGAGALLFIDAATFLLSIGALGLARRIAWQQRDIDRRAANDASRRVPERQRAPDVRDGLVDGTDGSATRRLYRDMVLGLVIIWRDPVLRAISTLMVVVNLFAPTVQAQVVVYVAEALRLPGSATGLLLSAGAVGALTALQFIDLWRRRVGYATLLTGAFVVQGGAIVALALTGSVVSGLLLWAVFSGAGMVQRTLMTTLRQHIVNPEVMGRVFVASMTLAWSVIPVGVLAGGFGTGLLGVEWVFATCGAVIVTSAMIFHRSAASRIQAVATSHNL